MDAQEKQTREFEEGNELTSKDISETSDNIIDFNSKESNSENDGKVFASNEDTNVNLSTNTLTSVENSSQNKSEDNGQIGETGIIDRFHTLDVTDSESVQDKCDEEPMDIDEILDSLNKDQEHEASSKEFGNTQSHPSTEESSTQAKDEAPLIEEKNEIDRENVLHFKEMSNEVELSLPNPIRVEQNRSPVQSDMEMNENLTKAVVENKLSIQDTVSGNEPAEFSEIATSQTVQEKKDVDIEIKETTQCTYINENDVAEAKITNAHIAEQSNEIDESIKEQVPTNNSVNVFDLLLENEDFFAGADENMVKPEEPRKPDEMQTSNVEISSTTDPLEDEKSSILLECYTESVPKTNTEGLPVETLISKETKQKPEETSLYKECLNIECSKKSDTFYDPPEFVFSHFHLNKRSKKMFICDECYDMIVECYGELGAALLDKQPLFLKNIKYTDLVEIIDSSDEEDDEKQKASENDGMFDAATLELIETDLEAVIKDTLQKIDIGQQMDWNRQILKATIDKNAKNCTEMMNEMKDLQGRIDKLHANTFGFRHTFVEEVQSLDLTTLKPVQICNESYPPAGDLKHSDIEYNTLYYTFRNKLTSRWMPCKVTNKLEKNGQTEYVTKFCREKKDSNVRTVLRKHLAYGRAPDVRLNIGTRVIAVFDDADNSSSNRALPLKNNFYPGVVAEPLSLYTNWRYLVFFDDGWVQYVYHENIRVICECTENVWELIEEPGAKTFIEGYVKEFKKKRPIVQVRRGQRIQTELNGKWYNAIVNSVDGSVVQVFFEENKRYEWIYRGSTRLFPLYKKLKHMTMATNPKEATIEYIVIDDDKEPERSTEPPAGEITKPQTPSSKLAPTQRTFGSQAARDTPQQKQRDQKIRAVAKKSTAPLPKPAIQHMNNSTIYVDEDKPKGKVIYYTAKKHIDVKKYIHHECQPSCLVHVHHNLSTYSPLSKPLLSGFERQICKTRFNKKYVVYRAPCGRRLRNMPEMHKYLRVTNCKLNVDNFTFDPLIHCLAEYVIESFVMKKADLSEGIEKMPVQLVNCYDNSMPPPCQYSAKRIPTEGVNLNCDSEYLCGCDCTDDCLDKTKCACWQLTLQGAKYGNPDTQIDDVGYQYKRLNEPVPTGIYECNSRCKCKSNCLNRLVQHPLQLKLQVFKTVNRGWGLRCLNDVPRGSFICCYAGNLLTETSANEAGGDLGDEYFAELDYIEVVENMKEGYEPEVVNDEIDSSSTDEDFDVEMESIRTRNDDSDDEFIAKSYTASEDSESRRYRTRNSVETHKKTEPPAKEGEKRKERNSSSDDEGDDVRQVKNFMASTTMPLNDDPDDEQNKSIRKYFGKDECVYVMDAKKAGNIGRYFNHSCGPNLFVQNVFVDTHDLRFPWVAFFASTHIRAGTELTWNYNYEVGSVPGKVLICQCGDEKCRGRIL